MRIEEEIKQKKFKNEYEKLAVNILFTSSWMGGIQARLLKPFGISVQQYNILRILKGQSGKPATVKLLTERMIDKMSNASRLVDKLVIKELVERRACDADRRQVDIFITDKGVQLIEQISNAFNNLENELSNIDENEAKKLNGLLDKLRGN